MTTDTFSVGELVITPTSDERDYRARITSIHEVHQGMLLADVKFEPGQDICDYGCYRVSTLTKI